jgi:hypothetical protein
MAKFKRALHDEVVAALARLEATFLDASRCYYALGGSRGNFRPRLGRLVTKAFT